MLVKDQIIRLRNFIANYSAREIKILVNLFVIVTALLLFSYVAKEVISGDTLEFDEWVLDNLRQSSAGNLPIGPDWFTAIMTDITAMGGATILFMVTTAVVFYLVIQKEYKFMWLILIATIGGAIISFGLKELFSRERPPIFLHLLTVKSMSFPSGHAMMSSVVYLTQGALLAKVQSNKNLRIYILLISLILVFLIGISRIYLGVHYPTDVLAGWSVGLFWASLCWMIVMYIQRKKEKGASEEFNTKLLND